MDEWMIVKGQGYGGRRVEKLSVRQAKRVHLLRIPEAFLRCTNFFPLIVNSSTAPHGLGFSGRAAHCQLQSQRPRWSAKFWCPNGPGSNVYSQPDQSRRDGAD